MFRDSWKAPSFTAPSPKKQSTTSSGLRCLREPDAGGDRHVAADDGVAAAEVPFGRRRGASSRRGRADAGGACRKLGHEARGSHAARQRVAVVAVVRDDVVVGAQRRIAPTADRLLADVEVQEAADLALARTSRATLLEAPDEEHLTVSFESFVAIHVPPSVSDDRSAYTVAIGASQRSRGTGARRDRAAARIALGGAAER